MSRRQELAFHINRVATQYGLDPVELGTLISYETAGTFDPWKKGPTTKWGEHRGLIQWGEPQRKQYGVTKDTSIGDQMNAVGRYLYDRGVRPGHGRLEMYSAINAGGVGKKFYGRTDAHAGGAPGTVRDKVNNQMAGHYKKAMNLVGQVQPNAVPSPAPNTSPQVASAPVNNQLAATQTLASQAPMVDIMGQQAAAQQASQYAQQMATQQAAQQATQQSAAATSDPFGGLMSLMAMAQPQQHQPATVSTDPEPGIGGLEAMNPMQAAMMTSHTPGAYAQPRRRPRVRI